MVRRRIRRNAIDGQRFAVIGQLKIFAHKNAKFVFELGVLLAYDISRYAVVSLLSNNFLYLIVRERILEFFR